MWLVGAKNIYRWFVSIFIFFFNKRAKHVWWFFQYKNRSRILHRQYSIHLKFDCEVMLNCRHDTWNKLEEEEKTILNTRFAPIALYLFNHFLHYGGVIARVNAQLLPRQLGMSLKSHCFLGVVCHDVLEHLILREQVSILRVPLQP